VEQALEDPDWIIAMEKELKNFKRNEVWELVPRLNQNVIDTKWVFRNKQDEFSVVTKTKGKACGQRLHSLKAWTLEILMLWWQGLSHFISF
jgi:TRAP-type C4-dicarboxylate transport system substrate-binding protein